MFFTLRSSLRMCLGLSPLVVSNFAYPQADSIFVDHAYHYRIAIPQNWVWEKIDKLDSPLRISVTSPDEKSNFAIIVFKSKQGNVNLERLSLILESDSDMKEKLGERLSYNKVKRYGIDVIEKRYERKRFLRATSTTAEYLAKREYGYIVLYTSQGDDDSWQNAFRQSLVFNFPESAGSKVFRFSALVIALIFLYVAIQGAAEPFVGKKAFAPGLASIFYMRKRTAEIKHQKQEQQRLDTQLSNRQKTLHKTETEVNQQFEHYWNDLKTHITVQK